MSNEVAETPRRMVSVDALRGFDMFWLVGGTGFAMAVVKMFNPGVEDVLLPQFEHCKWDGCMFYDLIYPLFIFVVGMSVVFSIEKYKGGGMNRVVYGRIARRFVLLFLLGVLFYGGSTGRGRTSGCWACSSGSPFVIWWRRCSTTTFRLKRWRAWPRAC